MRRRLRGQHYPRGTTLPAGTYVEVLDDQSWNGRRVTRWRPARVVEAGAGEAVFDGMLLVHDGTNLWWWNDDHDHDDVVAGRPGIRVWFHVTRVLARARWPRLRRPR